MTSNAEFIRAVYRTAEGDTLDPAGWRASFTEDAVFNIPGAESWFAQLGVRPDFAAAVAGAAAAG